MASKNSGPSPPYSAKIWTGKVASLTDVYRRQVLTTVDWRPSPVDYTNRPALCTAWWRLGVTQRVVRSVGVS